LLAPLVSNLWLKNWLSGRYPHVPRDNAAQQQAPCLSASPNAGEVRWGKGKYFIKSSNSFNFSVPSHQNFLSEAADVLIFVGGLHHINFSIPAPSCIFSPIMLRAFSTFQRGFPASIFKAALSKQTWLGVIHHSGRG